MHKKAKTKVSEPFTTGNSHATTTLCGVYYYMCRLNKAAERLFEFVNQIVPLNKKKLDCFIWRVSLSGADRYVEWTSVIQNTQCNMENIVRRKQKEVIHATGA